MAPAITLLCLLLLVAGLVLLVRQGFRDGDRFGDAVVRTRLTRVEHPDGAELQVEVLVDNRNDSAAIASARVRPASVLGRLITGDVARRTASLSPRSLGQDALLGAVDGREERRWRLPVTDGVGRLVRVTTRVDQVEGRSRLFTAVLRVPAAWRVAHVDRSIPAPAR